MVRFPQVDLILVVIDAIGKRAVDLFGHDPVVWSPILLTSLRISMARVPEIGRASCRERV